MGSSAATHNQQNKTICEAKRKLLKSQNELLLKLLFQIEQ